MSLLGGCIDVVMTTSPVLQQTVRKKVVHMMAPLFTSNPNVLNGTACFAGTDVSVQSLFDYLSDGATVGSFLADFPGISWEQVEGALEERSEDEMDCLPRLQPSHYSVEDYLTEN